MGASAQSRENLRMSAKKKPRKRIDWELAQRLYRTDRFSNRQIAAQIGCTESALRYRAKKHAWKKDLSNQVHAEVDRMLAEGELGELAQNEHRARGSQSELDAQVVQAAASSAADVIREHRTKLKRAGEIADVLFQDLRDVNKHLETIEDLITMSDSTDRQKAAMRRAVSVHSRAATLRDLSTAMKNFVAAEREAWNLNREAPPDPVEDLDDDELDQAILAAAAEAGVKVTLSDDG